MKGRGWPPSTEALFGAAVVLFGFRAGARPISDNSMFVHLRTGIDMVAGRNPLSTAAGHGIPRRDPYSFTALGHRWVVQSWLPEWTYGWAHRLGGFRLVVVEQALLCGFLAWLLVRLARAGSPLRSAFGGLVAVGVGVAYWAPRPLLFGLVAMALLVTIVERRGRPWLLVPLAWVWVSSHGSFPLGLVWLVVRVVGEVADREQPQPTLPYVGTYVIGLAVAALNPLGPRLLTFPLTVGNKQSVFRTIVEWHTPDFQSTAGLVTLGFLVAGLVLLLRRPIPWRDLLPVVLFLALGLLALRNVAVAAIVLAPALGRALQAPAGTPLAAAEASLTRDRTLNVTFAAVLALTFVVFSAAAVAADPIDVSSYPVAALHAASAAGLLDGSHRMAEQDVVGCYLVLRDGRRAHVFVDDRYDMYPVRVSSDYEQLLHGGTKALGVLDHYRIDVVLWDHKGALVSILRATGRWRTIYERGDWAVLQRT